MTGQREIWVDYLRVAACFMVMIVHSTEPFYLGGEGSQVLTPADAWWSGIIDALVRCCVPLFIVASSYLQFPIKYSTGDFFRRRALRILPPFILWSLFYAFWWGNPVENLRELLLNFNYAAGHLWFVYMLIGLYLIMPLLSPWAEKVGKKELSLWLLLWLGTTFLPLVRNLASGGVTAMIEGPSGVPQTARYPLWGEASWNVYGTVYYISGLAGYLLLGLYFRKFRPVWTLKKTIAVAVPVFLAGFAITALDFIRRVFHDTKGIFPFNESIQYAVGWETLWSFDSIGVVMMTIAVILLFSRIKREGGFYRHILLPVSKASYGMYLMHLAVLALFSELFRNLFYSSGLTTPAVIICTSVSTFIVCALLGIAIQHIPRIGKFIVG